MTYTRGVADTTENALSPGRSALGVFAGFVVLQILGMLFLLMAGSMFPSLYPSGEGAQPTTNGLVLSLVAEFANALVAGLITARLAGRAPMVHATVLAALVGFFSMAAMGDLRTMPGWFALGFVLLAPIGCLLGGLVARLRGT